MLEKRYTRARMLYPVISAVFCFVISASFIIWESWELVCAKACGRVEFDLRRRKRWAAQIILQPRLLGDEIVVSLRKTPQRGLLPVLAWCFAQHYFIVPKSNHAHPCRISARTVPLLPQLDKTPLASTIHFRLQRITLLCIIK